MRSEDNPVGAGSKPDPINPMKFSHIKRNGVVTMVDVSAKPPVKRTAAAEGFIRMAAATLRRLRRASLKKGDALACARIAGIMAAKKTPDLIPLCHSITISDVSVEFMFSKSGVRILTRAVSTGATGVEMEALTAAAVAGLTLYDMCKAVDKKMVLGNIRLIEKTKEPLN